MQSASAANAPWLEVAADTFSGCSITSAAAFDTDAEGPKINKAIVRNFLRDGLGTWTTPLIFLAADYGEAANLVF
jgi:hypothetical protein